MTEAEAASALQERPLPLVGAQLSSAGGWDKVPDRVRSTGAEVVQLFSSNPRTWRTRAPDVAGLADLGQSLRALGAPLFLHSIYLINLASPDPELRARSTSALAHALFTAVLSGAAGVVTHLGSHRGEGFAKALPWIASSLHATAAKAQDHLDGLAEALATHAVGDPGPASPLSLPPLLLETSAGSGATVGTTLEELAAVLEAFEATCSPGKSLRLGLCLDSAHLFAAGYPIHRSAGLAALREELEHRGLLGRLGLMHLNDSASPFASNRDRHADPGEGQLGHAALVRIVRDPVLRQVPFVLEVPGPERQGPTAAEIDLVKAMRRVAADRPRRPAGA